jgi:capsular polysaccharide biosynthesis protein
MDNNDFIYENEIDIRELFGIVRRRLLMIIAITLLITIIGASVSFFVLDKQYEASTKVLIGKPLTSGELIQYHDVLLYQRLVKTYGEIAQSRSVAERTVRSLNLGITPEDLQKKVKVNTLRDTEIIEIRVTDTDPKMSANIANRLTDIFSAQVMELAKVEFVQVIDDARVPISPVKPRPLLNTAISGVLGLMLGLFTAFILEFLDNTIKTPEDVEKYLKLPIMGAIPDIAIED